MLLEIGSKVKTTVVNSVYSDIIGTVFGFHYDGFERTIRVKIEKFPKIKEEAPLYYKIGDIIHFYEKDLELVRSTIDPASMYQHCSKCDVLTVNKPSLCCDHKRS